MARQHRLDLSQLDAEAPQLDLEVQAAGERHLPVGQVASQVARAVDAVPGLAGERVDLEPSAVSSSLPR